MAELRVLFEQHSQQRRDEVNARREADMANAINRVLR
jgi:hypothetical protein